MQHAENRFTQQAATVASWTKMELIEDPMPIPPPPSTFHCPKCGWHKTVALKSDVHEPAGGETEYQLLPLMDYYNWRRPHQHNDGITPAKPRLGLTKCPDLVDHYNNHHVRRGRTVLS